MRRSARHCVRLVRHVERYQHTLNDWNELVQAMDQMGLWGVATIEHHFHSEGYEVGPNPGVLTATGRPRRKISTSALLAIP